MIHFALLVASVLFLGWCAVKLINGMFPGEYYTAVPPQPEPEPVREAYGPVDWQGIGIVVACILAVLITAAFCLAVI